MKNDLHSLRGETYKKVSHMWRQDKSPGFVANFADYCKWKWNFTKVRVTQLIQAYEVWRDINEGELTTVNSSQSEGSLRPFHDANLKVDKCWRQLMRDENEKAKEYLAMELAEKIFNEYPNIMDKPLG